MTIRSTPATLGFMSGGHFGYGGFRIQQAMNAVAEDEDVKARWPKLAQMFEVLAEELYNLEHDIDWCLSGDTSIDDDAEFDRVSVEKVLTLVQLAQLGPCHAPGTCRGESKTGDVEFDRAGIGCCPVCRARCEILSR